MPRSLSDINPLHPTEILSATENIKKYFQFIPYFYKYLFWNILSRLFPHPVSETNPRQLLARAIYTRFLSFKNNNGHVFSHKLKCIIPRHFWGWHKKRKQMWKPRAVLWGRGIAAWSVFIAGSVSDAVTYQCIYRGHQSSPALFFNPHQEKGY